MLTLVFTAFGVALAFLSLLGGAAVYLHHDAVQRAIREVDRVDRDVADLRSEVREQATRVARELMPGGGPESTGTDYCPSRPGSSAVKS